MNKEERLKKLEGLRKRTDQHRYLGNPTASERNKMATVFDFEDFGDAEFLRDCYACWCDRCLDGWYERLKKQEGYLAAIEEMVRDESNKQYHTIDHYMKKYSKGTFIGGRLLMPRPMEVGITIDENDIKEFNELNEEIYCEVKRKEILFRKFELNK